MTLQPAPDAELEITGEITGLAAGVHGIQIREFGDFTQGAATAGAIFNPDGKPHGGPLTTERMGESNLPPTPQCPWAPTRVSSTRAIAKAGVRVVAVMGSRFPSH